MKIYKSYYILLIGFFLLTSCSDFLDMTPTNSGDAEESIKTNADAKFVLNGIMRKLSAAEYYGRNFPLYGDVKGGDLAVYSQGRGFDYLYAFNHSAESNPFSSVWTQGYHVLVQINNLLESIERIEAEGSPEDFSNSKGQALTARAIVYFDLVKKKKKNYLDDKSAWGVPLVTEKLDANAKPLRATVEENYKQIIKDLDDAQPLLSKSKDNGFINYYANLAMQARVYLYMGENEKSLAAAEEIIESGVYSLYSNDKWVDSWSEEFGSESIFELAIYPSEGDLGTGSLGAYLRRSGHGSGSILGFFMASDYFIDRLAEDLNDVRHGIMSFDETSDTRMGSCYKYSGSINLDGDKGSANSTAVNIKVIRLSEVYLIAAEAALSIDKDKSASYYNEIRKRSPGLAQATSSTISLDMIMDERSKELIGEGHRFFDMIRWNQTIEFNDELGNLAITHRTKTIDRTFYKTLLPIPIGEINTNPEIEKQQNPGY